MSIKVKMAWEKERGFRMLSNDYKDEEKEKMRKRVNELRHVMR